MDNKAQLLHRKRYGIRTNRRVRTCLMCGKGFRSESPHNRRCYHCNNRVEQARESSYYEPNIYSIEGDKRIDSFSTDQG